MGEIKMNIKNIIQQGKILIIIIMIVSINLVRNELSAAKEAGNIIYVDDDNREGPWNGSYFHPYHCIKDGINNASNGDTIYVFNGKYYENLHVDKTLKIIGESKVSTIIDGNEKNYIFTLQMDHIEIRGFTLRNCGTRGSDDLIEIESDYNVIEDNILGNNTRHCIFLGNSIGSKIVGNVFSDSIEGIDTFGNGENSDNLIENNIFNNVKYAITLPGNRNKIINNKFLDNDFGVNLRTSNDNVVSSNEFIDCGLTIEEIGNNIVDDNSVNGKPLLYLVNKSHKIIDFDVGQIILVYCSNISITDLDLMNTDIGIQILSSNNCTILNNSIKNTSTSGIKLIKSTHNKISGNCIKQCCWGIYLESDNNHNLICNNEINENNCGIMSFLGGKENKICCNQIISNDNVGLGIDSDTTNISKNTIIHNNQGILADGSNISIQHNLISENNEGIILWEASGTIISHNRITRNNEYGVKFEQLNTEVLISNNDISKNKGTGITILGSHNIIKRNNIIRNNLGIFLYKKQNEITNNNIILNKKSVYVSGIVTEIGQMYNTRNMWKKNYWGHTRILPKIIVGSMTIYESRFHSYELPYVEFEVHPKKIPNIIYTGTIST